MGQMQVALDLINTRQRVEALEARMDAVDGGDMVARLDALEKMGEEILDALAKTKAAVGDK